MKLNPEQRKAIVHGEGPLLVIAGPGSGKTSVITQRIVHLLQRVSGLLPENILALTYTRKAAEEMKARVSAALGETPGLPHISTFHSLCEEILQENNAGHSLLNEIDVWIFLRRRMDQLRLEFYQKLAEPGAFLHDLNDFFSQCQDELIEPDHFEAYVTKVESVFAKRLAQLDPAEREIERTEVEKKKELARVFRVSRSLIEAAGCSSLGSLISETIRLFDSKPEVLEKYRDRFRYFLVDEFQDTNYGQVELLRRLVSPPLNITAVGDDDQAIYRFRGASHGAFDMFARAFPGLKTVFLFRNHRSTKRILRCADVVVAKNTHKIKKPALKTEKEEGASVFLVDSPDNRSEAAWMAGEIERLVSRGNTWGDIAVLYRAHSHRDLLVDEFRRRKIPFSVRGLSLLSTVILRDLIAYLKLIHSPRDNISLTRVLLSTHWRFPEDLALAVRQEATKDHCSLFDAVESMEKTSSKNAIAETGWHELKNLLYDLKRSAEHTSVPALLDLLIARLGLNFLEGDDDRIYVEAFRKFLVEWEPKSETQHLREFIEYFGYFVEAGGKIEAPEPHRLANAVRMMTVHAAKGLEFPVVFVLSVAPRRFPTIKRKPVIEFPEELRRGPDLPADIHEQEERRLFFVAMTRAKDRLYISSIGKPDKKSKAGRKNSILVDDLLSNPVVRARDIETIQAPEVSEEDALPAPSGRAPAAAPGKKQPGLFPEAAESGYVHPPLAEWSARPPAHGPGEPDGKLRLSASAVEAYLECPLKFKYSHLLKIPTGPQAALTFGNIMHRCVRRYFELRVKGVPQFEEIEKFYLESWKDVGFEDAYQEDTYKKAGLEQLRQFVERHKDYKVPAEKIRFEEHFAFDFGDIVMEGRIDQIDPLDFPKFSGPVKQDGGLPVELIDYKTGRPRSQKEADKSLQLSVYALAARRQLKLDPARLTLYYLTNNQTVSTLRTEKDLDLALEKIREVAGQIRSLLFDPMPGFVCKWCDFVPICPAHEDKG
ncbi:MAG: ATP-dependent helicase [Terriglobia bacterium]